MINPLKLQRQFMVLGLLDNAIIGTVNVVTEPPV